LQVIEIDRLPSTPWRTHRLRKKRGKLSFPHPQVYPRGKFLVIFSPLSEHLCSGRGEISLCLTSLGLSELRFFLVVFHPFWLRFDLSFQKGRGPLFPNLCTSDAEKNPKHPIKSLCLSNPPTPLQLPSPFLHLARKCGALWLELRYLRNTLSRCEILQRRTPLQKGLVLDGFSQVPNSPGGINTTNCP